MVNIQQCPLRAFEHNQIATLTRHVQQFRNVNDHTGENVGNRHHITQHFVVVNGFFFVVMHQLEVIEIHDFFQLSGEGFFIKQVADAQCTTGNFVFISRSNTAACCTNGFRTARFFTRHIHGHMVLQD